MRKSVAVLLVMLVTACSKPSNTIDADLAVQRLCNQITGTQKRMIVNAVGEETLWSDGALMERGA